MTTRLNALADRASGAPFGLSNYGNLEADINYLVSPGANLVTGTTLTITNEFHVVTGAGTVATITDALGAVGGQQVRLLFLSSCTIQNNGGGVGNIRTESGADISIVANEVVTLVYDATNAVWRVAKRSTALYRTSTLVDVNATASDTDLLGGGLIVPANALDVGRTLRLTTWGDYMNNWASTQPLPQWKVKLGATPTVALDTSRPATGNSSQSATRFGWRFVIEITNLGATNSQWVSIDGCVSGLFGATQAIAFATGGGAYATLASAAGFAFVEGGGAAAIDTTAAMPVLFTVANGVNNVAYSTRRIGAIAEVI